MTVSSSKGRQMLRFRGLVFVEGDGGKAGSRDCRGEFAFDPLAIAQVVTAAHDSGVTKTSFGLLDEIAFGIAKKAKALAGNFHDALHFADLFFTRRSFHLRSFMAFVPFRTVGAIRPIRHLLWNARRARLFPLAQTAESWELRKPATRRESGPIFARQPGLFFHLPGDMARNVDGALLDRGNGRRFHRGRLCACGSGAHSIGGNRGSRDRGLRGRGRRRSSRVGFPRGWAPFLDSMRGRRAPRHGGRARAPQLPPPALRSRPAPRAGWEFRLGFLRGRLLRNPLRRRLLAAAGLAAFTALAAGFVVRFFAGFLVSPDCSASKGCSAESVIGKRGKSGRWRRHEPAFASQGAVRLKGLRSVGRDCRQGFRRLSLPQR